MKWTECGDCGEEFKVIHDTGLTVDFCPFCGSSLEIDLDEEEDYYDE